MDHWLHTAPLITIINNNFHFFFNDFESNHLPFHSVLHRALLHCSYSGIPLSPAVTGGYVCMEGKLARTAHDEMLAGDQRRGANPSLSSD